MLYIFVWTPYRMYNCLFHITSFVHLAVFVYLLTDESFVQGVFSIDYQDTNGGGPTA